MFEKEAEEKFPKCWGKSSEYAPIWQDGAEFGYNKANEWHYVKDGDLPKEDTAEKETLYLLWFGLDDSDYMTGVFSHGRFWCFDSGWYETNEVIAWQEIVPPSEPMRSLNKEEQKSYTKAINKVYKPTGAKLFDKESE